MAKSFRIEWEKNHGSIDSPAWGNMVSEWSHSRDKAVKLIEDIKQLSEDENIYRNFKLITIEDM